MNSTQTAQSIILFVALWSALAYVVRYKKRKQSRDYLYNRYIFAQRARLDYEKALVSKVSFRDDKLQELILLEMCSIDLYHHYIQEKNPRLESNLKILMRRIE